MANQCLPCGMERDTLTLGDGMRQPIQRFASQCQGLEHEGSEDLLQGYVAGLWSTAHGGAMLAGGHARSPDHHRTRSGGVARAFGANHPGG